MSRVKKKRSQTQMAFKWICWLLSPTAVVSVSVSVSVCVCVCVSVCVCVRVCVDVINVAWLG